MTCSAPSNKALNATDGRPQLNGKALARHDRLLDSKDSRWGYARNCGASHHRCAMTTHFVHAYPSERYYN
jgi:hypothetical protein